MTASDDLIIPVRIVSCDARHLQVEALNRIEDCPQCARGEGCGARPWFRGLFRAQALTLPRLPSSIWHSGDCGELHLPAAVLNRLAAMTYGVPLAVFLILLILSQTQAEALQLLIAAGGAAASAYAARRYGQRQLQNHLSLQPLANCGASPIYHPRKD